MNVFDAWLIIVGLAIGAGLAWLVMLDLRRRDDDLAAGESRAEAGWIADTLRRQDIAADAEAVEEVLRLHRAYLAGIPDDGNGPPAAAGGPAIEANEPAAVQEIPAAEDRPADVGPSGTGALDEQPRDDEAHVDQVPEEPPEWPLPRG
ncbi:MAG TPA: hypothetical protein VF323_12130 [Candidatus Limnocylindrales bacterium]